jgi:hypothetical protein
LGWMKIKKLQKYSDSKIGKRGGENEWHHKLHMRFKHCNCCQKRNSTKLWDLTRLLKLTMYFLNYINPKMLITLFPIFCFVCGCCQFYLFSCTFPAETPQFFLTKTKQGICNYTENDIITKGRLQCWISKYYWLYFVFSNISYFIFRHMWIVRLCYVDICRM